MREANILGVIAVKVQETLNQPSTVAGTSGKEDRKAVDIKELNFQGQLKRVENRNFEERINDMVDRIMEQGEKLAKKADIRELKIYKNMISEFLDEAVKNSHKFSKQNLLDRRGRYKAFATVKKINEHLDLLTKDVLKEEKDNINILNRIDDIRGLILDIKL